MKQYPKNKLNDKERPYSSLHVLHVDHRIIKRSGQAPGSFLTSPAASPEQRGHKLPEIKLDLRTFRMRNNRTQSNNDGVLFSSILGERRPSSRTDASEQRHKRVCNAVGREVSALLRRGRRVHPFISSNVIFDFLRRYEHKEKVKCIPVVKEVRGKNGIGYSTF